MRRALCEIGDCMEAEFYLQHITEYGYRRVDTYLRNVSVLMAEHERGAYILAVISQNASATLDDWQLTNYRMELERLTGTEDILFVIFTLNAPKMRFQITEDAGHWLVDLGTGLEIGAGQPGDFHNLKDILSQIDALPGSQERSFTNVEEAIHRMEQAPPTRRPRKKFKDVILTISVLMIFINVVVFLIDAYLIVRQGGNIRDDWGPLQLWGTLFANFEGLDRQYYRMFTCMFLHADIQHLVGNMLTLYFIGTALEKVVGHVRFLVIYIVGGLVGSVIQYIYYTNASPDPVSMLGASGAIFALIGALLYVMLRNYREINRKTIPRYILYILLSIYSGIMNPRISLSAHLGGFLGGILLAVLLYHKPRKTTR